MSDIFRSTASYYRKYRDYDKVFLHHLSNVLSLETASLRILDIGTGTGQLAMYLSPFSKFVLGIDISDEMIAEAILASNEFANIEYKVLSAEAISEELGHFDLITFGSSFHWLDKPKVLYKCKKILKSDGRGIIIGSRSVWNQAGEWIEESLEVIKEFLGERRKAGSGYFEEDEKTFEEYITEAGFTILINGAFEVNVTTTVEEYIGGLYSTSFANIHQLGEKKEEFEMRMRELLEKHFPSGIISSTKQYYYIIFA
ncbi:MAG: methyltransferase domain-containing protein [Candidatus Heimdallarchaeota archaeon]|nr:methyltransferase domain-containing protein [Candidatus Heimdallarchaeota archaeon]